MSAGDRAARPAHRLSALLLAALLLAATLAVGACADRPEPVLDAIEGGDPALGRAALEAYGCGTCHEIPGVPGARGRIGPSLAGLDRRPYLGGVIPNSPQHLVEWIMDPRAISPSTLMPDLGVGEQEALHMAAYLASDP